MDDNGDDDESCTNERRDSWGFAEQEGLDDVADRDDDQSDYEGKKRGAHLGGVDGRELSDELKRANQNGQKPGLKRTWEKRRQTLIDSVNEATGEEQNDTLTRGVNTFCNV